MSTKGNTLTQEHKDKISKALLGVKHTEERKRNESLSHIGLHHSPETIQKMTGENGGQWLGDDVGYRGVHHWIQKHKGLASNYKCEDCENQAQHWSNCDHLYKRILSDYRPLCVRCHKKFDRLHNIPPVLESNLTELV